MASRRSASDTVSPDLRYREPDSHPALDGRAPHSKTHDAAPPCTHCSSHHVVHWGAAHGLPRYRCLGCKRTFNILTNTPLARLRNKERWLTYVGTMFERKSVRESAVACSVSPTTSFRWRHRLASCTAEQRAQVLGAVIAAYSNAPALSSLSGDASGAKLKELLPVILSWFL